MLLLLFMNNWHSWVLELWAKKLGAAPISSGVSWHECKIEISGLSTVLLVWLAGTLSEILDATSSAVSIHEDGASKNENELR